MMAKENIRFNEETQKFNHAVDLFFGMRPEKRLWILLMLYLGKEKALRVIDNTSPEDYGNENSYQNINWHVMASLSYDDINSKEVREEWSKKGITRRFVLANTPADLDCSFDELAYSLDVDSHNMRQIGDSSQSIFNSHRWESTNLMEIANIFISLSDEWYKEYASWAFDYIVEKLRFIYGKEFGMYVQPKEITNIVGKLLNATEGTVYNPYAGICSYTMAIGENCHYYGQEFSSIAAIIGKLNLLIKGKKNAVIQRCIPDAHWEDDITHYDYIVSTPPLGLRIPDQQYNTASLSFLAKSSRDALIKSVGVYPASICYNSSPTNMEVLSRLIDKDLLESVILLPTNLFAYSAIETCIIVVNKRKKKCGYVRFIDASDCFITEGRYNILNVENVLSKLKDDYSDTDEALISNDDIRSNDYKIYPRFYCSVDKVEFPEGYHIYELGDIIEPCPSTRRFEETRGHIAKIAQLSNDGLNCERAIESFEDSDNLANMSKVTEPVLLISMIREIKPTYCVASIEKPLFVHPNVSAYRIKSNCEWVNPNYLCFEISRRSDNVTTGIIPRISREVLLKTKVGFPSLDAKEQNLILTEAIQQSKLAKARELGLQELIDSMKSDYINEVRMRKHDMRPHLRELQSEEKLMRRYLDRRENMDDFEQRMSILLERHKRALDSLSRLVDVFSEEEQFGKTEKFDIDLYFAELQKAHNQESSGYTLTYERDMQILNEYGLVKSKELSYLNGLVQLKYEQSNNNERTPLFIDIAPVDFERIVSNIVENAREHGFIDKTDESKYQLSIHLSVDTKKDMYQIDFINNGRPLPLGMDKYRYGIRGEKAGLTGRTGLGGYTVKTIVEHYNGDYDIFRDGDNTVVRINLPIASSEYEQ